MTMAASQTEVRQQVTVAVPAEKAFAFFTDRFDDWWPMSHHIGAEMPAARVIEPGVGGRWLDRAKDGTECVWGSVLAWEPPRRMVMSWAIDGRFELDPDPAHASEVEVTFTPDAPVFRLTRKLARQKREGRFKRGRSIVAVRLVRSRPVRCIQVADPRGVFLITRSFIPTHNSSLGRLGLIVHATAGFVDPGFKGTLTLEITNLTRVPIVLWPGKPIAQLSFMTLDRPAERPYGHPDLGSHYVGQIEATESRYEGGPGAGD